MKKPALLLLITLLMTGCTPLREVRTDSLANNLKKQGEGVKRQLTTNLSEVTTDMMRFDGYQDIKERRTQRIETELETMHMVDRANVVIIENAAIVSINFSEEVSNRNVGKMKKQIKERVKSLDKGLRYVSVSASPEILEKLFEAGEERQEQELAQRLTRLRPSM